MFQERRISKAADLNFPPRVVSPDDSGIATATRGQVIESGAAGPCTLIGMVDRRAGVAVLGHFVRPNDVNEDDFDRMLAQARKLFKSPKSVEVFLAGCSQEADFDFGECGAGYGAGDSRRSRDATIERIVRAGYSRSAITTNWQDEVFLTQEMVVDLTDLSVSVETTNMDNNTSRVARY